MRQLLQELKRRNVYKVAVAYATVAFVGFQAVNLLIPSTRLPPWADELLLAFLIAGFPVALVVAWAFEVTPDGLRRTSSEVSERSGPGPGANGRGAWVLGLVVLLLAGGGAWYLTVDRGDPSSERSPGATDRARSAPAVGDRSIAVLPFEALGQQEPGPFAEGMHDELLTRLSNVSGLMVISRTSVQQYRNTNKTTAEIARELGVKWVVEGGVQEMSDQIQVNAQLIDPRTDTHAWAKSYRRDLTAADLFAIQTEITTEIARSLEARLSPEERERLERRPTEDLEAYRLYVQGRPRIDQRTEAEIRAAMEYFERAIRQDSSYALAWSGLADARSLLWFYDYAPEESVAGPALQAARRAVELEPELAEAHTSLGIVRSLRHEGPLALDHLLRAVELKPSYAEANIWLGWTYLMLGRPEEALPVSGRAVEIDPHGPAYRAYRAEVLLAGGRGPDALEEARRATELRPEYGLGHFMRGLVLHHLGRYPDAEAAYRRARSLVPADGAPTHAEIAAAITAARAADGDTSAARSMLSRVDGRKHPFSQGLALAAVGDDDGAFRAFRRVERWGAFTNDHIRYFFPSALGRLRADPRFEDLRRRLNRAWGLNPDGSLSDGGDAALSLSLTLRLPRRPPAGSFPPSPP
jgi:TolB-like protein/Flp pilus assembly protein TadD